MISCDWLQKFLNLEHIPSPCQEGWIMVPLLGMVSWEHIPMTLMFEHFEDEQRNHKKFDSFVAYV